jgi:hypothetical protein
LETITYTVVGENTFLAWLDPNNTDQIILGTAEQHLAKPGKLVGFAPNVESIKAFALVYTRDHPRVKAVGA